MVSKTRISKETLEIPKLEIVSEKTNEELICDLVKEHGELSTSQIQVTLHISVRTVDGCLRRLVEKKRLSRRLVLARVGGATRHTYLYKVL